MRVPNPALVVLSTCLLSLGTPGPGLAQARQSAAGPGTKLEAFATAAGTLTVSGSTRVSPVYSPVLVTINQVGTDGESPVRGMRVEVAESGAPGSNRREVAYVDVDEIPELLKAVDALLKMRSNPTAFEDFSVEYETRGKLTVRVYNDGRTMLFMIAAGRAPRAVQSGIKEKEFRLFRLAVDSGQRMLATTPVKR